MESKPLAPKLRFPEFRNAPGWKQRPLGSEALFFKGRGVSKAEIDPNGSCLCIRYGELYTRYGEVINAVYSRTSAPVAELFLSSKNDVIIPASGETKEDIATASCVTLDGVALGGDINVLRTKHNGVFLSYLINGVYRRAIAKVAQGDTVVHLYPSQLAQVSVALPEASEQQKIAECLTSLDELIVAEGRKLEALRAHKKGLMQNLFPREGEIVPRLRFPEFDEGAMRAVTLEQVVKVASGQVDPRQPPFCDLPHVGGENIESHTGRIWGIRTAGELQLISGKYAFGKEDILYSKIRPLLNKVAAPNFEGICSADIYPIRPATGELSRAYLFYLLQSEAFQTYATKHSDRGKIPKINREALLAYRLLIPHLPEQQCIAECLWILDALSTAQANKLDALKLHKQVLMKGLFPSTEDA
jgi:type I restriction enzyme S subunit